MENSHTLLIYFWLQKWHCQENDNFLPFFAKLTLKVIWVNIPRYNFFQLSNDFQKDCWDGCDFLEFSKQNNLSNQLLTVIGIITEVPSGWETAKLWLKMSDSEMELVGTLLGLLLVHPKKL